MKKLYSRIHWFTFDLQNEGTKKRRDLDFCRSLLGALLAGLPHTYHPGCSKDLTSPRKQFCCGSTSH